MKKLIVILGAALLALPVHAEQGQDAERFARMKEIKLQGIDGRLSALQQDRQCVQAATTHDAMKACEQASHRAMKDLEQAQKASWESLKGR